MYGATDESRQMSSIRGSSHPDDGPLPKNLKDKNEVIDRETGARYTG